MQNVFYIYLFHHAQVLLIYFIVLFKIPIAYCGLELEPIIFEKSNSPHEYDNPCTRLLGLLNTDSSRDSSIRHRL